MKFEPVKRNVERDAYCRSCDCLIPKGTTVLSWYSRRNRGMNIHICIPCSVKIGELAKKEPDGDTKF